MSLSLEERCAVLPIAWSLPTPEASVVFVPRSNACWAPIPRAVKDWRTGSRVRSCRDISCRLGGRCGCRNFTATFVACIRARRAMTYWACAEIEIPREKLALHCLSRVNGFEGSTPRAFRRRQAAIRLRDKAKWPT